MKPLLPKDRGVRHVKVVANLSAGVRATIRAIGRTENCRATIGGMGGSYGLLVEMSCGVQCRVKSSPSQRRRIEMLKHIVNVVSQYRPFASDVMRASEERQQSHGVH